MSLRKRHFSQLWPALSLFAACFITAHATEVTVVGLFPGKAVVVINKTPPRTLSRGQKTDEGVSLVTTDSTTATLEIDGRREVLEMGQHSAPPTSGGAGSKVSLAADERGHFVTQGTVNGGSVRFLVDTGATLVSLPASEARRLGINYQQGRPGFSRTANGLTPIYLIKLDTVQVGDIVINQVEAAVIENGLDIALLGMTFLNRTEMRRDGAMMTLTKRY